MEVQWSLVIFTALVGLGCWCFVGVAVQAFKGNAPKAVVPASVVSLVALVVGGLASVTHLSHPTRLIEALTVPTSSIFMEGAGTFLLILCIAVFLLVHRGNSNSPALRVIAVIGAVIAVVLSFVVGNSYVMASREAWDVLTLPIAYLATAMVCGLSVFACIVAAKREEGAAFYGMLVLVAGVIAAVCVIAYAATADVMAGPYSLVLWLGAVCVGAAAPAVCGAIAQRRPGNALPWLATAAGCAVVGAVCFRVFMWNVGVAGIDFFGML